MKSFQASQIVVSCPRPGSEGKTGRDHISFIRRQNRKNYFRDMGKKCTCPPEVPICRCGGKAKVEVLTKKSVSPQEDEIRVNPPSRSAV